MKYETIYEPGCLSEEEVKTLQDGFYSMVGLLELWEGRPIHLTEFQTLGFWHHRHPERKSDGVFHHDLVHIEYTPIDHWRAIHPENHPNFPNWLKKKKSIFDVEEFHHYIVDLLKKKLPEVGRDTSGNNKPYMIALYDLNFNFETHTDGADVHCKKLPRPENWSDLKPEDWISPDDEGWTYTHQGLIPIDVTDTKDGTIIFDQMFDYSVYLNMGREYNEFWLENEDRKQMIKIGRGDSIERFGKKVENFTNKPMSQEDYDWIMENCIDETDFPIEHGYGLSVETMCEFHSNGTLYDWQANRFHKTRPRVVKEDEKRVTLVYSYANFE